MIQKREIVTAIILSIVTCGIYGLYWFVCLTDDTNTISGDTGATGGGMSLVLTIVTCGIYGLYWAYKMGERLDSAKAARGLPVKGDGLVYIVLCIFGLDIVAYALMQDELNKMAQ